MPTMTLGQFIGHLAGAVAALKAQERHDMEMAAKLVEAEAKAEIGAYQLAAGPFSDWAELADATKEDRVNQGYPENEPGLRTGEMRDSIDHAVGDREAVVGSDNEELVYFELGTPNQPPRPVLGIASVNTAPRVAHILGAGVVKALVGSDVAGGSLPIP